MLRGPKVYPVDFSLFIALSEPQARRRVSKRYHLPSGAIIVLITVEALRLVGGIVATRSLHNAKLMSPSLLRKYLALLIAARLVERYTCHRRHRLRMTLAGMGVVGEYSRWLLGGARQYVREQAIS